MPEWVKDKKKWEDAKKAFKKSYDKEPDSDSDWAIVTNIYKKMDGKIEGVEAYINQFNKENTKMDYKQCLNNLMR